MIHCFIGCRDVVVNSCEFHTFSLLDSEGLVRGPSKAKNFFAAQPRASRMTSFEQSLMIGTDEEVRVEQLRVSHFFSFGFPMWFWVGLESQEFFCGPAESWPCD